MNSTNTVRFNSIGLSRETIAFVQSYNTGLAKIESIDNANDIALKQIDFSTLAAQLTKVLATSTFIDSTGRENGQSKQTFKISCQRSFVRTYPGKALAIKGNTCTIVSLTDEQTIDFKGKVVIAKTAEQLAEEKQARKNEELARIEKAEQAEQAIVRLETTENALKQAENTAALATKFANETKKQATADIEKAKSTADILAEQVAELTLQLERAKHETAATVNEYQQLKALVLSAKNLKSLQLTLKTSGFIAIEFPERNLNQVVNA